jgi:glycosyltransferase involved in cell wall biosynthesis
MAFPKWLTPEGNLGVVPELDYYQFALDAYDVFAGNLTYSRISGVLPEGIQIISTGILQGIPITTAGGDKNEKFTFVLVGDGHERTRLQARCRIEGLINVQMFDPVPKSQIPSLLSMVDIGYIGWRKERLYRFGIAPNKLMDYMMANLPILHSVEAANDPVADAGCGLTVPPESPESVARGLLELSALGSANLKQLGALGRPFVTKHYSYKKLAEIFIDSVCKLKSRH